MYVYLLRDAGLAGSRDVSSQYRNQPHIYTIAVMAHAEGRRPLRASVRDRKVYKGERGQRKDGLCD